MLTNFLRAMPRRQTSWTILVVLTGLLLLELRLLPMWLLAGASQLLKLGVPDYGDKILVAVIVFQFGLQAAIGYCLLRYMPRGHFYTVLRLVVVGMVILAFRSNWPWLLALQLLPLGPNPEGLFG